MGSDDFDTNSMVVTDGGQNQAAVGLDILGSNGRT